MMTDYSTPHAPTARSLRRLPRPTHLPRGLSSVAPILTACALALGSVPALAATPEAYHKRWNDPALEARIQANIENHRKGPTTIEVVDAAGSPLSQVRVELQQIGHHFLFGCNAFVLGQLKTPEANRQYEEAFARLFNFATVPFYWEGTEPAQGELRYQEGGRDIWRRPPPNRYLPFAEKYGITLKGHPLLWHAYNPTWLPKNADQLRDLYRKRFREIADRYGRKISIWDVVNESLVCDKKYPLLTPDRAYVGWAFREVAPLFPSDATLMINEVNLSNFKTAEQNRYFAQVKALLAAGVPLRGIGFQFHYFRRPDLDAQMIGPDWNPVTLMNLYEAFGQLKLPLFITEITIPSSGPDGPVMQAEVVRNLYRLWFSVPMMHGITWWNLGDGTAVKGENEAQGGLVDHALNPKASYRTLDHLINEEWKTRATTTTDATGRAEFRGFFGKYRVQLTHGGKAHTVEMTHAPAAVKVHRLTFSE